MGRLEPTGEDPNVDTDAPYVVYLHNDDHADSWEVPAPEPYPTWAEAEACCKILESFGVPSGCLEIVPVAYAIEHYRKEQNGSR